MDEMPQRMRALLLLNGVGLLVLAVAIGWIWFFALLHHIVLWPIPINVHVSIPDDGRAWRMAHLEGITQGLVLMALGLAGRRHRVAVHSADDLQRGVRDARACLRRRPIQAGTCQRHHLSYRLATRDRRSHHAGTRPLGLVAVRADGLVSIRERHLCHY
jgi:hypothetical protein